MTKLVLTPSFIVLVVTESVFKNHVFLWTDRRSLIADFFSAAWMSLLLFALVTTSSTEKTQSKGEESTRM